MPILTQAYISKNVLLSNRQYATSQKAVRPIPDVIGFFNLPNSLSCTVDSVDSVSKINKYQEFSLGVKDSQLIGLPTSLPSVI